ncbi:ATP-binding protein [bacterium]|nr:ATP-binding protein [bacterium]
MKPRYLSIHFRMNFLTTVVLMSSIILSIFFVRSINRVELNYAQLEPLLLQKEISHQLNLELAKSIELVHKILFFQEDDAINLLFSTNEKILSIFDEYKQRAKSLEVQTDYYFAVENEPVILSVHTAFYQCISHYRKGQFKLAKEILSKRIYINSRHILAFLKNSEYLRQIRITEKRSSIEREHHSLVRTFYIVIVLSLLFSYLITFLIGRNISRPIHKLTRAIQNIIQTGDLSKQLRIKSNDETGILAKSFNTMIEKVVLTQNSLMESSKMASLGVMSAGVAHEINQPLGALSLNSESIMVCLERGNLEKIRYFCEQNIFQIHRATRIIDALKGFSRNNNSFEKEHCSINLIIENMVLLMGNELHLLAVDLNMDFDQNLPDLYLSQIQMEQVISNIVINARDAVEQRDQKNIWIRTFLEESYQIVEIEDNGCGISKDNLVKIFDPFYTSKDIGKGTGLGLSLSYGMVESNSGKISVKSELGKGSTFTIKFKV